MYSCIHEIMNFQGFQLNVNKNTKKQNRFCNVLRDSR